MDICDKKNQIQDLLNEIYSEYNRINETKIQTKCETDLEMRTMISNIRSLESSSVEKDNRIKTLEKTVCDYEKIIEDLNSKLELKEEFDRENNRHDMLRTLSKDISEKDREIKRLNDLLEFHKKNKETKKQKIDNIIEDVKNKEESKITLSEVDESINKETGEVNPNFIYEDLKEEPEPQPSPGGSIHPSDNETIPHLEPEPSKPPSPVEEDIPKVEPEKKEPEKVEPEKVEPEVVKTLLKVKKNNKTYFVYKEDDPDQDVYEYNEEKRTDKIIGKRKRVNGKWSWKLF